MKSISSRDNPQLKTWRRLAQDTTAYRKAGQFWLEGDHLCRAALERGVRPLQLVLTESFQAEQGDQWRGLTDQVFVLPDALFASLSGLESPARMGFVVDWRAGHEVLPDAPTVVLDRLQDAGNVGAILRCASAFGYRQVLAIKGTAALWSPKVLRAGMGAHFGLHLVEGLDVSALQALQMPLLVTSSHQGEWLHRAVLPWPCAWVMGHEGQGASEELMQRASTFVRIAQPGGEESLNVAAAAAICLHASAISRL